LRGEAGEFWEGGRAEVSAAVMRGRGRAGGGEGRRVGVGRGDGVETVPSRNGRAADTGWSLPPVWCRAWETGAQPGAREFRSTGPLEVGPCW
jgi:hypothetical protein